MTGRNRHDPQEPMQVLCPVMRERIGANGTPYRYGFGSSQKFLLFRNSDGATWRLCAQPLSPTDRTAVPVIERPPSEADLEHAAALRRLAEPSPFVSGLPDRMLDPTRRRSWRR